MQRRGVAKSRRGGKRPGAGRKLMLPWKARLDLGAEAEERLRKAAEVRRDKMVADRNDRVSLREKWARLEDCSRPQARAVAQAGA